MRNVFKEIHNDERGGGATVAIKGLVLIVFISGMLLVLIDFYYLANVYRYVKDQQELANRAVYAAIDMNQLAERNIFIDEVDGREVFEDYLTKNLDLDAVGVPNRHLKIVGSINVKNFEIYNTTELPNVTPNGVDVDKVSVYSEIEVEVEPLLVGKFGTITIRPHMTTYIPEFLIKTFHP